LDLVYPRNLEHSYGL